MTQITYQQIIPHIKLQNSIFGFERFVYYSQQNSEQLFEIIKNCQVDEIGCRFNIWRMSMKVIDFHSDWQSKVQVIEKERKSYLEKRNQAFDVIKEDKKSTMPRNPLMKVMAKPEKSTKQQDDFLKQQIKKDVDRTYQQMDFFQNQKILKLLTNVLYVWCKRNPQVSYKQGMNEILASLVYVYFQSAAFQTNLPQGYYEAQKQVKDAYHYMNSTTHAEADIYSVFEKVMHIQKQMYKTEADQNIKGVINPSSKNNTPILLRIIDIKDHKLKMLDLDLFRVIKLQQVQTKSFMLKWIRCMHTREFGLIDSFTIWDSIFLDYYESPSCKQKLLFEFIDAMCVAMFIYLRSIILSLQTKSQILQQYQKYPVLKKGQSLEELISLAWSLCAALRNQENIKANNWYQDSQKSEKVQTIVAEQQIKQNQERKKRQQQAMLAREKINESPSNRKIPSTKQQMASTSTKKIQATKSPQDLRGQAPQKSHEPESPTIHSVKQSKISSIQFSLDEIKQMESFLKQSIRLNEDLQSKRLSNKVLKMIQNKVKEAELRN